MARKIQINELTNLIEGAEYTFVTGTTLTICVLRLKSGFTVTGTSGTIDTSAFDMEIGKKIAYDNAFNQLWNLEGYYRMRVLSEFNNKTSQECGEILVSYS